MAEGGFVIKDSGQRESYTSGMVRDVTGDKTNVALAFDGPMLWRWAHHLTLGAVKYAKRNWMKASGEAELERFRESAARHFAQWYRGDADEDHAAAILFNINGAEYVKDKLRRASVESESAHSPVPPAPASQRSSGSADRQSQAAAPPQARPTAPGPYGECPVYHLEELEGTSSGHHMHYRYDAGH